MSRRKHVKEQCYFAVTNYLPAALSAMNVDMRRVGALYPCNVGADEKMRHRRRGNYWDTEKVTAKPRIFEELYR